MIEAVARRRLERFLELSNQLLEDRAHGGVIDLVRVQVDVFEALQHLKQETAFIELAYSVVEVELFQHFVHVRAETRDVIAQVCRRGLQEVRSLAGAVGMLESTTQSLQSDDE